MVHGSALPPPRLGVVHVRDPRVSWCVRAAQVLRIAGAAEWWGPVIDVLALIQGAPSPASKARRIVIVRVPGGPEIGLDAAGPIDVADVAASDVLALPPALAASAPRISAIVVARDTSLSLLLELTSVSFAEDTVLGEELCPGRS